jgi:hypothetical protein
MIRMETSKKNRLFFLLLNGMIEDPTLSILYLTTHTVRCVCVVDTEYGIVSGVLHTVNMMFFLAFI